MQWFFLPWQTGSAGQKKKPTCKDKSVLLFVSANKKNHPKGWFFFLPKSNQTEQNRGKGKQKYTYYLSTSARSNLILNVNSSG
jgi:hypothetical protein